MASRSLTPATPQLSPVDGLVQLSFLIQNSLARLAGEHGLSIIQTRLLGILRDREPSMNELAVLLELDKSSVSGLVDRAEARGLVERIASTADRRVVRVCLTDDARSLISTVSERFAADVSRILESLSIPERRALSGIVSQLLVAQAAAQGIDLFATTP